MRIDVLLEPDQSPAQLTELAQLCERYGIGTMWQQNYVSWRDPFMSLVPAAQATKSVGLGVCVVSPWEMHPVKMASALLTLHEFGKGRAALVIGGGGEWPARLGIEVVKRVRCVREAIELVHRGVRGKSLTYQGQMFKVYGYNPSFGATAPPLVYAGANQPQMLHATVPAADGVMYSDMPRARVKETVRLTQAALADKARPAEGYHISNIWAWHIKADREVALREARRELLLRGLLDRWYLESFLSAEDCDLIEKNKNAFFKAYRTRSGVIEGVPDRIVDACLANFTFTGTPADIDGHLAELTAFRDAGVNELCFRLHDDPAYAIRIIGERIVPALR
ncbi:MAG: LLM class flavin-dependent oxidoreductase [Gammaproteobacteria bacterium]|nr:MAG: LLM class flavin-dependent oxidoreductase [Gammaproteobacteria bacterium]